MTVLRITGLRKTGLRKVAVGLGAVAGMAFGAAGIYAADPSQPLVFKQAKAKLQEEVLPAAAGAPGFGDAELLDNTVEQIRVFEDFLTAQVQKSLNEARSQMGSNPPAARELLKQAQQAVRGAADIRPDIRFQLNQQIESALRAAASVQTLKDQQQVETQARQREIEERDRLTRELFVREEKLDAIMQRMEGLMDERNYEEAAALAELARDTEPRDVTAVGAVEAAELNKNLFAIMKVREMRTQGFAATLFQSEKSSVPFPDDPPVVYPDPGVWQRLTEARKKYAAVDLAESGPAERRIRAALDQPTELDFQDAPLNDVKEFISQQHNIDIVFDIEAMDQEGVNPETPVTVQLSGVSLRNALKILLKQHKLTYLIKYEVLYITSQAAADLPENHETKVYPVADLVIPIETAGGQGMGLTGAMSGGGNSGFGGGNSGFAGGGGQGFGGGGGGMGGGMGGMGGGGGGFFNVPAGGANQNGLSPEGSKELRELIETVTVPGSWDVNGGEGAIRYHQPTRTMVITNTSEVHEKVQQLQKGLRAFNVKDDVLTIKAKGEEKPKAEAQPKAEVAKPAKPASIDAAVPAVVNKQGSMPAQLPADVDPETLWGDHFTNHQEPPAAVREAVRKLSEKKQFKHVIGLINAALRNNQGQPWMYEALGLALQADGRDKKEIERTLLSGLDMQYLSADSVLYMARYLAMTGCEARALKLYQQAAALEPTRPEPYIKGLPLAQRLFDVEAVQWAVTGMLGQAWTEDNQTRWLEARSVAQATVDMLRATRMFKQAEEFQKSMTEALQRDLIVVVSWTGEADIDLLVQEPSGTICSSRNPRTTSGGVFLGDAYTGIGEQSSKLISETYICAKAFDGPYQLKLRRAWGKPTANRVTVEVYSKWGSPDGNYQRQQITLKDDDSKIQLTLAGGRRDEVLEDRLVANAVDQQLAVRREILAQQLDQMSGTSTAGEQWWNSQQRQFAASQYSPFFNNQSAVGYQPVIIVLSEGATMQAQGVISADRRYVRFTGTPFFSGIGDVTIFNIQTGSTTTQPFQSGVDPVTGAVNPTTPTTPTTPGTNVNCPLNSDPNVGVLPLPSSLPASGVGNQDANHRIIVNCQPVGTLRGGVEIVASGAGFPPVVPPVLGPGFYRLAASATVFAPNGLTSFNLGAGTIIFVSP